MQYYAKNIKDRRIELGLGIPMIAAAVDVEPRDIWDLELNDDEFIICLTIRQVCKYAKALQFSRPSKIFSEASPGEPVYYSEICKKVSFALKHNSNFEWKIGWKLQESIETIDLMVDQYPILFLQSLCAEIGVAWLSALDGLSIQLWGQSTLTGGGNEGRINPRGEAGTTQN